MARCAPSWPRSPSSRARCSPRRRRGRCMASRSRSRTCSRLPWRGYHNGTRHELGARGASGVYRRLRDAGAVVVGVDNQHELGLGTTGIASPHGAARNPWNLEHCTGGSSSGSAAAVAATDDRRRGGQRQRRVHPASRRMVRSGRAEGHLRQRSPTTATRVRTRRSPVPEPSPAMPPIRACCSRRCSRGRLPASDAASLRVGVVRRPYWEDLDADVEAACRDALAIGRVRCRASSSCPLSSSPRPPARCAWAPSSARPCPPWWWTSSSRSRAGLLLFGALQPAQRLVRADRVRARLRRALAEAFATCDLLAWPTNSAPAPPIDAPLLELPSGPALPDAPNVRQAILANITGVPGVSVPVGFHSSGLPIGLQLLAPWGEESRLLDAAERIEVASEQRWVKAAPAPAR